uniref:Uncharacterized protein n=1 Tax=Arundo donax TaxID=35708 RepID=A0A0A9AHX6_ARUDO
MCRTIFDCSINSSNYTMSIRCVISLCLHASQDAQKYMHGNL